MPVRSLNSSVFAWPDRLTVETAARQWIIKEARARPNLVRCGYFGSYATGRWGFGSDLDLVAVIAASDKPFDRRAIDWDLSALPVPAELLVYTQAEWESLIHRASRFAKMLEQETVWVFERG